VLIVGPAMAEIASKYPLRWPLLLVVEDGWSGWGWFTGWFNLIGQIAITAGIDYGAAGSPTASAAALAGDVQGTSHEVIYVYGRPSSLCTPLMNIFSVQLVALLNTSRVVALPRRADHRRVPGLQAGPPSVVRDVFGKTINNRGFSPQLAVGSCSCSVSCRPQYTYTGYDASAHMSEETQDASRGAARGVIMSIIVSAVFATSWLSASPSDPRTFKSTGAAGTFAVKQIFIDSLGRRPRR